MKAVLRYTMYLNTTMTAMSMLCWVKGGCYSLEEENGRGWVHMETPAALNN